MTTDHGAAVTEVQPDTPAAKAGVKSGDVIVQFDEHPIESSRDLQNVVEKAGLGASHKLVVSRAGKLEALNVVLQTLPASASRDGGDQAASKSDFSELGMEVSELTNEAATRIGLKDTKGVVISAVTPQGPADSAGLTEGMVISRVGQTDVTNVDSFRSAVAKSNLKSGVMLLVKTAEGSRFLVLKTS
jgi:serine protease Do